MKKILIALVIATVVVIGLGSTAHANPAHPGHRVFCRPIVGHPLPAFCTTGDNVIPRDPGTGQAIRHHFHQYRHPSVIRVKWADYHVSHRRVVGVDEVDSVGTGRYLVWFNNGAAFYMHGCVYEDGHRCVWNAHERGNHIGKSFVQLHRHWYYY